jgi:hypothetical protein
MPDASKAHRANAGSDLSGRDDPRTEATLGRPRGRYPTFADHLARLKAAEPHATAERLIELEREAAQATRQPAAYTDVTVSFSKSISVLHASIRENERRAHQAEDDHVAAYWAEREAKFQDTLHRANRSALDYLQAWAGVTPTGYHGARIDGNEPGQFVDSTSRDPTTVLCRLSVTTWCLAVSNSDCSTSTGRLRAQVASRRSIDQALDDLHRAPGEQPRRSVLDPFPNLRLLIFPEINLHTETLQVLIHHCGPNE